MSDPAQQLQQLYLAGCTLETFDRYANAVGVVRDGAIALLAVTPAGLSMIGTPGWRMGEVMGVLVEKDGRQVFQAKGEELEATPERLEAVRRLREDVEKAIRGEGCRKPNILTPNPRPHTE